MKSTMKCMVLLLAFGLAVVATAACAPAATSTATPVAASTSAPASGATAAATRAPTSAAAPTAAPTKAPTASRHAPEVPRISLDELKALVENKANIAILDVRPKESYDLGHIKGAVSFPWKQKLSAVDLEMLPSGDPIITYCDCGPTEHDSADVAKQLAELGVAGKTMVLADPSIEGWIAAGYPTE